MVGRWVLFALLVSVVSAAITPSLVVKNGGFEFTHLEDSKMTRKEVDVNGFIVAKETITTEEYVNSKIEAQKTFITSQISTATTDMATEGFVTDKIGELKQGGDLATKLYVDDKVKQAVSPTELSEALTTLELDTDGVRDVVNDMAGSTGTVATKTEVSSASATAESNAKAYTDTKIGELTLDADAVKEVVNGMTASKLATQEFASGAADSALSDAKEFVNVTLTSLKYLDEAATKDVISACTQEDGNVLSNALKSKVSTTDLDTKLGDLIVQDGSSINDALAGKVDSSQVVALVNEMVEGIPSNKLYAQLQALAPPPGPDPTPAPTAKGTATNPGTSCLDILTSHQAVDADVILPNGVYYVQPAGASASWKAYCDMTFDNGGWTLVTAQRDGNYFSESNWDSNNRDSPSPTTLYSALKDVDAVIGDQNTAEYLYRDHWLADPASVRRWVQVEQSVSVLQTHPGFYTGDFKVLRSSSGHVPGNLDGFGKTIGGAGSCKIDGHLHNWFWCIAQTQVHTGCSASCSDGLVTGVWNDLSYCDCQTGGMSFWVREKSPYIGGTADMAGVDCGDILAKSETTPNNGRFWIKPEMATIPYVVWCDFSIADGGWTLLSTQRDGSYFTDSNYQDFNAHTPDPKSFLYSALGKVDEIRNEGNAEYLYVELDKNMDPIRWTVVEQSVSILSTFSSKFEGSFRIISSSGGDYPSPNYLTGFAHTIAGSSHCKIDANIHNWIWCIAATQSHTACNPDCGDGLVTGIWNSGAAYCDCDIFGVAFYVRRTSNYVGATAENPAESCAHALELNTALTDGRYWIKPEGATASYIVYCDMTTAGGGWTLLSGQNDANFFTASNWLDYESASPPMNKAPNLYSILGKADEITKVGKDGYYQQYLYAERTADEPMNRWAITEQAVSIMTSYSSQFDGYHRIVEVSGDKSPSHLTGYALSNSGSAQCKISGNIHNWVWCAAATATHSGCGGCGNGLVTSIWEDRGYCDCSVIGMTFWGRDVPINHGNSHTSAGKSCKDIKTSADGAADGLYWIQPLNVDKPYRVYCDMTTDGGGWTLLSSQKDSSYFTTTNWKRYNEDSPSPLHNLYSILDRADEIRGTTADKATQYLYKDHDTTIDRTVLRWVAVTQTPSIMSVFSNFPSGSQYFKVDKISASTVSTNHLTGFARSTTSACMIDGNVHNWVWCVAQVSVHNGCSADCGDGLVTSCYSDYCYCDCKLGAMSFWIRE